MASSSIQSKIITVLMQPRGVRRSRLEIANLTGISAATVYRALNVGILGVVKDTQQVHNSNTRPAEVYYWDQEAFSTELEAEKVVSVMPIPNNSTATKVTDLSGIPKSAMQSINNSLLSPAIHEVDVLKRMWKAMDSIKEDVNAGMTHEELRQRLIEVGAVILQLSLDIGKQSDVRII